MEIDEIFSEAGDMGRQQWKYILLLCILQAYLPFYMLQYIFVCHEVSSTSDSMTFLDPEAPLNRSSWGQTSSTAFKANADTSRNNSVSVTFDSAVTEWNLVGDWAWLKPFFMAAFMTGFLFGWPIMGSLSNKIGRKSTLIFNILSMMTVSAVASFVHSYAMYCFFNVVVGYFCGGCGFSLYALSNEFVSGGQRSVTVAVLSTAWSTGVVLMSGMAYFIHGWRAYCLVTSAIGALVLICLLFVPESPRWLVSKRKYEQADRILEAVVTGNGKRYKDKYRQTPPAQSLVGDEDDDLHLNTLTLEERQLSANSLTRKINSKLSFCSLCIRNNVIFGATVLLLYIWFVVGLGYFSLTIVYGGMSSSINLFAATAISGAVEYPAVLLATLLIRQSRRLTLAGFLLGAGLCGLLVPITSSWDGYNKLILGYTCKMFISACYPIIIIYSSEIFPCATGVVGFGSAAARIGFVLSPFFVQMDLLWPDLNYLILGVLSTMAGCLVFLWMPDTVGQNLPKNMEDVVKFLLNKTEMSNPCTRQEVSRGESEYRYSMLAQQGEHTDRNLLRPSDKFENVNFDYDDFSGSDSDDDHLGNGVALA